MIFTACIFGLPSLWPSCTSHFSANRYNVSSLVHPFICPFLIECYCTINSSSPSVFNQISATLTTPASRFLNVTPAIHFPELLYFANQMHGTYSEVLFRFLEIQEPRLASTLSLSFFWSSRCMSFTFIRSRLSLSICAQPPRRNESCRSTHGFFWPHPVDDSIATSPLIVHVIRPATASNLLLCLMG